MSKVIIIVAVLVLLVLVSAVFALATRNVRIRAMLKGEINKNAKLEDKLELYKEEIEGLKGQIRMYEDKLKDVERTAEEEIKDLKGQIKMYEDKLKDIEKSVNPNDPASIH